MPKKKAKSKKSKQNKKITLVTAGVILALLVLVFIAYFFLEKKYNNKIYYNISIGEQDVAGQSYMAALDILDEKKSSFDNQGLVFTYQDETLTVPTTFIKDEASGISVDILNIDTTQSVDQAYKLGRTGDIKKDLLQKIKLFFTKEKIDLNHTLDEEELKEKLLDYFADFENPAQNAQLSFTTAGEIQVLEESDGESFMWPDVVSQVEANVLDLDNQPIALTLKTDKPELKKDDTQELVDETTELLALAPLTFNHEDDSWNISEETLQTWLMFSAHGVALNEDKTASSLEDIAMNIDQPVKEGKFSLDIKEDESIEVQQFQEGEDGLEVNLEKTVSQINSDWLDDNKNSIDLIVEITKPKATPDNMNELGIKELLGTGTTNFSGSPSNRIHNIKKGAEILSGLLIAPGETFSLVETIGHVDGEHGWLPELVIKENKTIPEYGGGLCQIGTTSFRTTMMAGLDVVERQNHSYAVSYYDYKGKPGVDATIYEPKPDYRFKNDTDNYILWRSRIEGYDIYFEFWGTSDGRQGSFGEPVNYNWKSPPETIINEVDTLDPGVMNCTEKAHTGLTAEFDYIITNADGEENIRTFKSVYKALPAICDRGKENEEKEPEQTDDEIDSSEETEENTNTNTNKKKKKKNKNNN